jgi:bifunctional ADP-heptose synthase (sugar kinase/adenylyltransferase)
MRVLVVGEEMRDEYFCGSVERLNPEKKSVPLIKWRETKIFAGGAANVAANLRSLGVDVVSVHQEGFSICKQRLFVDGEGVVARLDFDRGLKHSAICPAAPHLLIASAARCDAVVVADYGKGFVTDEVAEAVKTLNLPTFVACKRFPNRWKDWATAMIPNLSEYLEDDYSTSAYHRAAEQSCIVTCGADGARILEPCGKYTQVPIRRKVMARNVCGAGDTFLATYAALMTGAILYHGADNKLLPQIACAEGANMAAGIAVEGEFTSTVTIEELASACAGVSSLLTQYVDELSLGN